MADEAHSAGSGVAVSQPDLADGAANSLGDPLGGLCCSTLHQLTVELGVVLQVGLCLGVGYSSHLKSALLMVARLFGGCCAGLSCSLRRWKRMPGLIPGVAPVLVVPSTWSQL